jgi:ribosomal protein S13
MVRAGLGKIKAKSIADEFRYASNTNTEWLSVEQIAAIVNQVEESLQNS